VLRNFQKAVNEFIGSQSAAGLVLALAALLALLVSNSPWRWLYEGFVQFPGELRLGGDWLVLSKPLVNWVNELWMTVFFFLVGLELKRELLEGELATPGQAVLPAVAALGGMALPGLIYAFINRGDALALAGWAIPTATDIAFALGVLVMLGPRVPVSLKVFLTAVAIIDDLGAILIIAFFYTEKLSAPMLYGALAGLSVLVVLNRLGMKRIGPYAMVGVVIWLCVLKSGIHATLAGAVVALAIPLADGRGGSPLKTAEHALQPWVAFLVLPMFALTNAGVSLAGVTLHTLSQAIPLGIGAGLLLGKTFGVLGASALMIGMGWARLPDQASWQQMAGVAVLCGVGFTMSLFIGALAFDGQDPGYRVQVKLGVLGGSLLCAALGSAILWFASGSDGRDRLRG
jgi:NhaA family Na+:H+ antiporter